MILSKNYNLLKEKEILISTHTISKFYKKSYVISEVLAKKNYYFVHTGDSILPIFSKKKNLFKTGFSNFNTFFLFKHVLNKNLQFKSLLYFIITNNNKVLINFLNTFSNLLKKKKSNMLLLNPVRGGYFAFYLGIFGFISKENITQVLTSLQKQKWYFKKEQFICLYKDITAFINKETKFSSCYLKLLFLKTLIIKQIFSILSLNKISLKINKFALKQNEDSINSLSFFKIVFSHI
jgi:hypothetical protein